MHYPQYYSTVIRNPETAAEMEPYCASCFPKHKPRASHPFDDFTLVSASLCSQKKPHKTNTQTTTKNTNNKIQPTKQKKTPTPNLKVREVQGAFENKPPQTENHLINLLRGIQAKQLETEDSLSAVLNPRPYLHTFFDKHLT